LDDLQYTITDKETSFKTDFSSRYKGDGYQKFRIVCRPKSHLLTADPQNLAEIFSFLLKVPVTAQQVLDHSQLPLADKLRGCHFSRVQSAGGVQVTSGDFFQTISGKFGSDAHVIVHGIRNRNELVGFFARVYEFKDSDPAVTYLDIKSLFEMNGEVADQSAQKSSEAEKQPPTASPGKRSQPPGGRPESNSIGSRATRPVKRAAPARVSRPPPSARLSKPPT
jgi:hypothetical protein